MGVGWVGWWREGGWGRGEMGCRVFRGQGAGFGQCGPRACRGPGRSAHSKCLPRGRRLPTKALRAAGTWWLWPHSWRTPHCLAGHWGRGRGDMPSAEVKSTAPPRCGRLVPPPTWARAEGQGGLPVHGSKHTCRCVSACWWGCFAGAHLVVDVCARLHRQDVGRDAQVPHGCGSGKGKRNDL